MSEFADLSAAERAQINRSVGEIFSEKTDREIHKLKISKQSLWEAYREEKWKAEKRGGRVSPLIINKLRTMYTEAAAGGATAAAAAAPAAAVSLGSLTDVDIEFKQRLGLAMLLDNLKRSTDGDACITEGECTFLAEALRHINVCDGIAGAQFTAQLWRIIYNAQLQNFYTALLSPHVDKLDTALCTLYANGSQSNYVFYTENEDLIKPLLPPGLPEKIWAETSNNMNVKDIHTHTHTHTHTYTHTELLESIEELLESIIKELIECKYHKNHVGEIYGLIWPFFTPSLLKIC